MAAITISTSSMAPKHSLCEGGRVDDMRAASFSAYVTSGPSAIAKFEELVRSLPPACTPHMPEPLYQTNLGSKKFTQNGELKIFDAEKYFNGGIDSVDRTPRTPSGNRKRVGTPSSCSEVSWNSQHALLPSGRRDNDQAVSRKQASGKRYILGLGCNCSGKKSVDIDEHSGERSSSNGRRIFDLGAPLHGDMVNVVGTQEPLKVGRIQAKPPVSFTKEDAFTFPATRPAPPNMGRAQLAEEVPRVSLEVFGSPFLARSGRMDPIEHRRLMMSSMGTDRKIDDILATSGRKTVIDEDAGSEAGSDSSSDLFEIGVVPPCLSRQESTDDGSNFMDNASCYPPSEASIEWSVVTASAADFSAAGSEYGGDRAAGQGGGVAQVPNAKERKKSVSMVKEAQRRKPGSNILGCKSGKAIDVATNNHKSPEKPKQRSETAKPLTLYAGATRVAAEIDHSPRLLARSPAPLSRATPPLYAVQMI